MSLLPPLMKITKGLGTGIVPDAHDITDFVWADARNVRFNELGVRKMAGWEAAFVKPGSNPVRGLGQVLDLNGQNIFFGDQTKLYWWNTTTVATAGTGFSGITDETVTAPATSWSFEEWGNWAIATNGVDAPQIWKTSGNFANLAGSPPGTAEIVLKLNAYMLLFNTDSGDTDYAWCSADDVEDWVAVTNNTAGGATIRDMSSKIVAAVPLGTGIAVYGKSDMVLISFIGAPFIFGHKPAVQGVGAVSKYSVISVGRQNYGWSANGFFVTDGINTKWIDTETIRRTVFDEVNTAQYSKICGYHDAANTEIKWYYPIGNEPDKGVGYNYITNAWTFYGHGRTSAQDKRIFNFPLTAANNGAVYFEEFGNNADEQPLVTYAETKANPFFRTDRDGKNPMSMEDQFKYIEAIKLALTNTAGRGLKFRIGVQDKLSDPIIWTKHFYADRNMEPVYPDLSGRWITLSIESDQLGDAWTLQGFTIHGKLIGGPVG